VTRSCCILRAVRPNPSLESGLSTAGRSARTLGHAEMRRASTASNPSFSTRGPVEISPAATRKSEGAAEGHAEPEGTANTHSGTGFARAKTRQTLRPLQHSAAHGRDEEHVAPCRQHRVLPATARTTPPSFTARGARKTRRFLSSQAAVATWPAPWRHVPSNSAPSQFRASAPAWPNPSLKRSANGMPPGPGRRYTVHFRLPGPGGTPSAPA
jgi:hypothetical protein